MLPGCSKAIYSSVLIRNGKLEEAIKLFQNEVLKFIIKLTLKNNIFLF